MDQYRERVFWRRLGEIFHYIADYFTFPHNKTFTGSLVEHNSYEKELKNRLKTCIRMARCPGIRSAEISRLGALDSLTEYIREKHAEYLKKERNISDDIRYILDVCCQVFRGVCRLCPGLEPEKVPVCVF